MNGILVFLAFLVSLGPAQYLEPVQYFVEDGDNATSTDTIESGFSLGKDLQARQRIVCMDRRNHLCFRKFSPSPTITDYYPGTKSW